MPIQEKTSVNNTNITYFNNELILEENNFHVLEQRTNKVALAQTIQNLFFFKPGNFPNQPLLGIGIEDYLFEMSNQETLSILENRIKDQITMFIPTNYGINFIIETKKNGKYTYLGITFTLDDYTDMTQTEFTLVFGRNQRNKKLVSRLISS